MAQQKAVEPVEEVDDLIDELQPGAKLLKGQYTITRYLNSGGFGITYLAKDSLDRDVVIKECFPSSVCRRSKVVVAARSRAHTAELRSIVQLFVREARNLAKIVHPNIVAVHQVFEDNGTAYMAIDYIDGLDLQQVIDGEGEMLTPEHIVRITDKLLAAVGFIHDHDMLHRDISPDNVLVNKAGEPILIDFGAAREHASKTTRAMSALRVVKDGYSPQEFYIAGSEQGPWSDLYALGATIYHLISGEAPVNGQARLAALAEDRPDPYVPLTGRIDGYPPGYLEAIDRALCTLPKQRLQTAADWLEMYHNPAVAEPVGPAPVAEAAPGVDDAVHRLFSDFQREAAQATADASPAPSLAKAASYRPAVAPAPRGKSPVQLVAGIAVALVVVAGGYALLGNKVPQPDVATESETPKLADPAPAVATASLTPTTEAPKVETAAATPEPAATAPTAEVPAAPASNAEPASSEPVAVETAATEDAAAKPASTDAVATDTAATDTAVATASAPVEPAVTATASDAPAAAETAVADPAAETAAAAPVAADPAPAADPAAAETTAADTTAAETTPAPTTEAATTEVAAAEPAPVATAPTSVPTANQIAFAAWDVDMPFTSDDRMVDGKRVAVVTRFAPGVDRKEAGDWLAPGVTIYSVNGQAIEATRSLTVSVMNAMSVDPDGMARVVVEYSQGSREKKTGLLTVGAVRLVNLQNGVSARVSVVDGEWKTIVATVTNPNLTTLQPGDVLFRDKTTTTPLDGSGSFEKILSDLVGKGATETTFSIIRNNKVDEATMQLALAAEK